MKSQSYRRWWDERGHIVNRVLEQDWNPIGTYGEDEYLDYAEEVGRLLWAGKSAERIASYFGETRMRMRLGPILPEDETDDQRVAQKLVAWFADESSA